MLRRNEKTKMLKFNLKLCFTDNLRNFVLFGYLRRLTSIHVDFFAW